MSKTYNGVTTKYLWSGQNIIAEYDGAGTLLRRYVHGAGTDEPVAWEEYVGTDRTYYFHQDHLGTVVAVTDANGAMVDTYTYSSYGEVGEEGAVASIWRYTGRQLDAETGLYYYRARMYDPRIGRFLQIDPAGDMDSLNLYQYAMWDPINKKDPMGLEYRVVGSDDFKRRISKLEGRQSFRDLQAHDRMATIVEGKAGVDYSDPKADRWSGYIKSDGTPNVGADVTITLTGKDQGPNSQVVGADGYTPLPSTSAAAEADHETVGHALPMMSGTATPGKNQYIEGTTPASEQKAVEAENKARAAEGGPLRGPYLPCLEGPCKE